MYYHLNKIDHHNIQNSLTLEIIPKFVMMNKEIQGKKDKLLKEHWTEELHLGLEELDDDISREIVESMTDDEIEQKVNIRQHQEDYIADYLNYLWDLSEVAYWKHIEATFNKSVGLLWGSEMYHYGKLCDNKISERLLIIILDFAFNNDAISDMDMEGIGCIIKSQIEKHDQLKEIKRLIGTFPPKAQERAKVEIPKIIKEDCNYIFN
jgi:hypothetical protein